MIPIGLSFRGPHQNSRYKVANDAALKSGWENARSHGRTIWNLDDFDVAKKEFHRVLDRLLLEIKEEREA
jgi:hypothetical protein